MLSLDAAATAAALPWRALADSVSATLADQAAGRAHVPERFVLPIDGGRATWFVMPAWLDRDAGDIAMCKLITFHGDNPSAGRPAIQGDVLVVRASTGERVALVDGPTVTARRTAAVSALAAERLAPRRGPLLVIGAGVQGRAHASAFAAVLGVREVRVASRREASARRLAEELAGEGLDASVADDLDAALAHCPLVVTATTAAEVCLHGPLRGDSFVAAVGSFKPTMIELAPALTRGIAERGRIVVDSDAARHEAGDLLQAGVDVASIPTLADVVQAPTRPARGPVLFKSCGAATWDLAAARCVATAVGRHT